MKKGLLSWIVLLLATAALVKLHLDCTPDLPARIASHFDMAGRANGWRTKDAFGLGTLPIHLGTVFFIVGLISFMHRLPPHLINVPNPEYWRQPANFQIACQYLRDWSRWFAASELIWATFFDHQLFLANQRQPPHLDSHEPAARRCHFGHADLDRSAAHSLQSNAAHRCWQWSLNR